MNVVIFGFGFFGKQFKRYCDNSKEFNVIGVIDNGVIDNEIWEGTEVISPTHINELNFDKVILAVQYEYAAKEMKSQIIGMGISKSKIEWIFDSEDLMNKFFSVSMYEENDPRINWIKQFAYYVDEKNMDGSVAECGVNRGDLAMYINSFFKNKKLFLFDTFEGFADKDIEKEKELGDEEFLKGDFFIKKDTIFKFTSVSLIMNRMRYKDNCIIKKGYFPNTTKGLENEKFCFVNLDMDLYQPQLEGLRFFYDKMVEGGVILLHDYYHPSLPGVKKAVEDFRGERRGENIITFPIGDFVSIAIIKS